MQPEDCCRELEAYLCRKNDGHLIRIVGPAFDRVRGWAEQGIPYKVACRGIDRCFERYYAKGPRRRPVRIDFCEADVLDVFDEWRRAVGLAGRPAGETAEEGTGEPGTGPAAPTGRGPSLPAHLERVIARLTALRGRHDLPPHVHALADAVVRELDAARASARGLRGESRTELLERLRTLDRDLVTAVLDTLPAGTRERLRQEAEDELAPFRTRMTAEAFAQACDAGLRRLIRQHAGLPTLTL
ncbi:MAG: hypothetical protein KGN76_02570 [Acidobacteriota bacterium]|nr:hypothetical protein [Acidobacteriota bacterium]